MNDWRNQSAHSYSWFGWTADSFDQDSGLGALGYSSATYHTDTSCSLLIQRFPYHDYQYIHTTYGNNGGCSGTVQYGSPLPVLAPA